MASTIKYLLLMIIRIRVEHKLYLTERTTFRRIKIKYCKPNLTRSISHRSELNVKTRRKSLSLKGKNISNKVTY